ncbi:HesA/MoeB/ThiF family protein [Acidomonas methanolica]|uniref:Molybdopterin-synthase adenylyltransferase n=1 Tax=Acidomonas methanolica NBRC 104435 TaxID=1231351 RepID=A0A023D2K2_ACIMT|nr:molybdopterin-synthase adenylyltransferase MoeB [Acidomonas methanolica]MBU2654283.1 molybdopterin-synthase adenylyltransferase MoeB [Acidomonas methanolica]TCS29278.1 adenylyltransferase/sulfurtransferase [Acidomonas methanolica]GAJ28036.1 molybdopterin biosynthesis protein MoeB [Acidomonas methanolica NBRC 104435]GEK99300.1 molybdopterin biosynthesis protein [Acidomonas methanolica NBRC 104435]
MTTDGPDLSFSRAEIERYSRNILLPEIGAIGQARLRAASVLVIGVGGLGAPVALYLAAAGIGRIGLVDDDTVDLSNLQRQILFDTAAVGRPKVEAAAARLRALNPEIVVETHRIRAEAAMLDALVGAYDLVCDGSDNFATRQAVSDATVRRGRTLVSGAVQRFEGQISTFRPQKGGPCYRCLYPDATEDDAPRCGDAGILGSVTGVIGAMMATEAVKEQLDIGESLQGRLLCWDALAAQFRSFALARDPHCPGCGPGCGSDCDDRS